MTDFSEKLHEYMIAAGINQTKLSRVTGINKSSICEYLSGSYEPKQKNVLKIAAALNIPPEHFWGMQLSSQVKNADNDSVRKIPLIGRIAAGRPILAVQDFDEYIPCCDNIKADFCLRISGDSMINAGILDHDYIVARKQDYANNGDIVVALIDGEETTVKRYFKDLRNIRLQPENPEYKPIIGKDNIQIMGKVVALFRML